MTLIEDWRAAYRFLSVRASAVSGVALIAWIATPADQQHAVLAVIGMDTPAVMALIGFIVVVLGRVIHQPPKE